MTGMTFFLLLTPCTLLLTSCSDYLETPSKSQLSTDNSYSTPANIDQDLTGIYGTLKPFAEYYYAMSEGRSDNLFNITESSVNEYAYCAQFNNTGLLDAGIVKNC